MSSFWQLPPLPVLYLNSIAVKVVIRGNFRGGDQGGHPQSEVDHCSPKLEVIYNRNDTLVFCYQRQLSRRVVHYADNGGVTMQCMLARRPAQTGRRRRLMGCALAGRPKCFHAFSIFTMSSLATALAGYVAISVYCIGLMDGIGLHLSVRPTAAYTETDSPAGNT